MGAAINEMAPYKLDARMESRGRRFTMEKKMWQHFSNYHPWTLTLPKDLRVQWRRGGLCGSVQHRGEARLCVGAGASCCQDQSTCSRALCVEVSDAKFRRLPMQSRQTDCKFHFIRCASWPSYVQEAMALPGSAGAHDQALRK